MKAMTRIAGSLLIVAAASSLGCSKSATNAMTETSKPTSTSAVTTAMEAGKGLFNYLGGLPGVNRLAEAFGLNIAKSPVLGKLFDAAALTATKLGLVNEIAKPRNAIAWNERGWGFMRVRSTGAAVHCRTPRYSR